MRHGNIRFYCIIVKLWPGIKLYIINCHTTIKFSQKQRDGEKNNKKNVPNKQKGIEI